MNLRMNITMSKKFNLLIVAIFAIAILFYSPMQKTFALSIEEEQAEEQISCKATLQDDFEDDSVIVVLNKQATFEFKDYLPEDNVI